MSMPLSSDEQIQKGMEYLNSVDTPVCTGCKNGVKMCHHVPCLGTVDDIEKIMDAGLSGSLMLDYWVGKPSYMDEDRSNPFEEDIMYLVPAIKGKEGQKAPFARHGTCTLLMNNMCSIHDLNLKPVQGRMACCKIERVYEEDGQKRDLDERIPILHTWNTQRGYDLIERWKKEVNFTGQLGIEKPETLHSLLDTLMSVLGASEKLYEDMSEEEKETIERERKTIIYKKPY